ncbi:MAG: Hpt domain-containing protein, partial [Myxococcaceae bacterium]
MEKERGRDRRFAELVDSMFRHAHSVKGMSASMGFEATATLAHRIEDLVDAVRTDPGLLNRDLVDLLFLSVDVLLSNVRAAGEGRPLDDALALRTQLAAMVAKVTGAAPQPTRVAQAVVRAGGEAGANGAAAPAAGAENDTPPAGAGATAAAPAAPAANAAQSADAPGVPASAQPPPSKVPDAGLGLPPRFAVKVRIAPSCAVPGVRGFLVHKRLSNLGNVFNLKPALE